jgi:hypothetical protein
VSAFQCISCGVHFVTMLDYYRHREYDGQAFKCLPPEQFFEIGIKVDASPSAKVFDAEGLFTQGRRKVKMEVPSTATADPNLRHACWLLTHGKKVEDLRRLRLSQHTIDLAIKMLEEELK